jgi:dTDP-4-amino-4,6-dideoxygalactose transaminase
MIQITTGISQVNRCDEMNKIRKLHSVFFQETFKKHDNIVVINNHFEDKWNHQYFVVLIKKNFNKINKELFRLGIHAMDENVWDCSKYNFNIENKKELFPVTEMVNGK